MAFQAQDGSKHTNRDTMKQADARHMAKQPAAQPVADPNQGQQPGQDILQSPEVQHCFQALAQAGVSPEEVTQAYAQVSGDAQDDGSGAPPQAGGM